jgi:hypothetical protein
MQLIAFPGQCQNHIEGYKSILALYQKVKNANPDKIIFDCGNVQFFRPLGLNLLACFISEILSTENHPEIYFTPPKENNVFEYIKNQGFFDCFQFESDVIQQKVGSRIQQERYSTGIRLKRLESLNYSYIEGVAGWLSENCSMDSDTAFSIFNVTLVEVINNVVQHSQSPIGCFVCAQAYPREDRLILSIVDFAKGFLSSLFQSYPQLRSNAEAINLAIQEGTTSKGMRNAGRGLWILSGFLKECSGQLNIVSGNGFLEQNIDGNITTKNLTFDLCGSCINIDINNLSGLANRF